MTSIEVLRRASRLASRGSVQRARALLPAEIVDDKSPEAHQLAGDVLRRASAWGEAAAHYAALLALSPDDVQAAALLVDSAFLDGGAEGAMRAISALDKAGAKSRAVAEAVLELATGRAGDARLRMRALRTEEHVWLDLLNIEALLEIGGLTGAEQALAALASKQPPRFTEEHVRFAWLSAWHALALVESTPPSSRDASMLHAAEGAVEMLRGYAVAFPLYRAWASTCEGELLRAAGKDPTVAFNRAEAEALAVSVSLKARVLARIVQAAHRLEEAEHGARLEEARKLLAQIGAQARLGGLTPKGAAPLPTVTRKSMAVRLEAKELTDETGLEAVMEVTRYLSSVRDLPTLFDRTLRSVTRVMGAERGALLRTSADGTLACVAAQGIAASDVSEGTGQISFGVVRESERTREPVLSENALSDQRFRDRRSVMSTEIRSAICAPLRTPTATLGYVYLDRRSSAQPFGPEHLDLLGVFCTQVAVAWENALSFDEIASLNRGLEQKVKERTVELRQTNDELARSLEELKNTRLKLAEAQRDALEKEMALARDIQRSILPPETTIKHGPISVYGAVIPASFCGGDFWGRVALDDGATLIVIADVTGHGVAAAMITAVARSCLDTLHRAGAVSSPADTLMALNDAIHRSAGGELCATAFAALFRPGQDLLFANAGHNFPLHVKGDGTAGQLVCPGVRLGEAAGSTYTDVTRPWQAGDRLLLFTDGLIEWKNDKDKEWGPRRMQKAVLAERQAPPERLVAHLVEEVKSFASGVPCDDDLTVVVVDAEGA